MALAHGLTVGDAAPVLVAHTTAALARQHKLSHIGFLETLLADEVSRRESRSAALRANKAGLDPTMRFDTWTAQQDLRYDRTLLGLRQRGGGEGRAQAALKRSGTGRPDGARDGNHNRPHLSQDVLRSSPPSADQESGGEPGSAAGASW